MEGRKKIAENDARAKKTPKPLASAATSTAVTPTPLATTTVSNDVQQNLPHAPKN
jgi:hypothetical protein